MRELIELERQLDLLVYQLINSISNDTVEDNSVYAQILTTSQNICAATTSIYSAKDFDKFSEDLEVTKSISDNIDCLKIIDDLLAQASKSQEKLDSSLQFNEKNEKLRYKNSNYYFGYIEALEKLKNQIS